MSGDDLKEGAGERLSFELEEDEKEQEADRSAAASPPARTGSGARISSARSEPKRNSSQEDGGVLDDRRRRRLRIYVPTMLLLYLFVGWFFAGRGLGWFALAGLGIGVFAGWRQRGEILLGSIAAVAGFAACLLAVQFPLVFVIVSTGMIGYIAGIDDRLRNS